ncbi:MAG TPA: hypothetical protein VJ838_03750 [Gaiellaceae bacterium]|nr:hypothetical protein [Gaiellaceae bacterium]
MQFDAVRRDPRLAVFGVEEGDPGDAGLPADSHCLACLSHAVAVVQLGPSGAIRCGRLRDHRPAVFLEQAQAVLMLERAATSAAQTEKVASAEADVAIAASRDELARLEEDAARRRSLATDLEQRVVEIITEALEKMESLDAAENSKADTGLLGALRSPLDR